MTTAAVENALLTTFDVGRLRLRNRVVMAPMTREASHDGTPTPAMIDYYVRRAAGGVGLIITEGTTVAHEAARNRTGIPVFHGDANLQRWSELVAAVHAEGAAIVPQLWHVGMDRKVGDPPDPLVHPAGPSGVDLHGAVVADPLSSAQIDDIVAAFGTAAGEAQRLGFDGIELHGAHGYLIDQFLWSRTNRRTDQYGGDIARRTRFAADVVRACRSAVSSDFPIIFRLSQWKITDFDARLAASPAELEEIVSPLAAAGVDVFHCSTRRYWEPAFEGSPLTLAGWVRHITGLPTIAVGSVGLRDSDFISTLLTGAGAAVEGLARVAEFLNRGEFDLVCVGRALISDPAWVNKIAAGRHDELVPFDAADLARLY
ncbi:2,4-dienoyl-CoA reductase-like NADH-dependent reductase (Old Yellow Enzyme family) [Krasilnikovia cinnamomea]|uniref:2,4-dienoyl-CoA reductase-like NADH-dependent reductase (Old Yellow Enzyme family) n=1 Tax=Krasilnikovia cinnamomea TaxID=349313 RepID=A0A4Q7ZT30_9ACTN|nr:NADH:flavin oxidoreductase [Krasilnikovia cinnamomea]RZU53803.1 2,4-dienoyl-CoA reductase-like NADH-dependent reductase (Old Yellow Enzyme family) [Krasilnikovia cinnamomea]